LTDQRAAIDTRAGATTGAAARSAAARGASDCGRRRLPRSHGIAGIGEVLAARTEVIQRRCLVMAAALSAVSLPRHLPGILF